MNLKQEAFDCINKALEINPKNVNYEEEEDVLYQLIEVKEDIETQISLAKCLNCQLRIEDADRIVSKIEQFETEKSVIYALKASLLKRRYQFKESLKYIDMAIESDKTNQVYQLEKGYILYYYGNYDEAIKIIEPFIINCTIETITSKLIGAVFIVAFAYQRIGNEEKYNKYILLYHSKKKEESQYYFEIAIINYYNKNYDKFELLIDKALKIQPKNIKAISVKINLLEEKGQFVEASKLKEKNKKEP